MNDHKHVETTTKEEVFEAIQEFKAELITELRKKDKIINHLVLCVAKINTLLWEKNENTLKNPDYYAINKLAEELSI